MEFDSCDCSGNWWGEEADDETLDEGECGEPGETDDECGHQQVPGGLGKVDEYEWDQEDVRVLITVTTLNHQLIPNQTINQSISLTSSWS